MFAAMTDHRCCIVRMAIRHFRHFLRHSVPERNRLIGQKTTGQPCQSRFPPQAETITGRQESCRCDQSLAAFREPGPAMDVLR